MKRALTFLSLVLLFGQCKKEIDIELTASFTMQNNNCKAPCEVDFSSTTEHASSYLWTFGDGQTSTEANPRHTYTKVGIYEVMLTANGAGGSSATSQKVRINLYQKIWDKAFGGINSESYGTLMATTDGGFLLGGVSGKDGTEFIVMKVGVDGNSLWKNVYGGTNNERYRTMIATADGGFLLAGMSISASSNESGRDGANFLVMKVGVDGQPLWTKMYGGRFYDELSSVRATPDGGFLLIGSSESPVSGDKSEARIGDKDAWLVKIGRDGTKQWDRTIGKKDTDSSIQTIIVTNDGSLRLVVGSYTTFDDPLDGPSRIWSIQVGQNGETKGSEMPWSTTYLSAATPDGGFLFGDANGVTKIKADGTEQWARPFGQGLHSIIATADGGFLLGGTSASSASNYKSENSKGGFDFWILKINADGQKQWDKTLGGSHNDELKTMVPTPDGGYLLGGVSDSNTSGDKTEDSRGFIDYWVVKINYDGVKQWEKTFGGTLRDMLYTIVATPDGGFLLSGSSESPLSGDKSGSNGPRDYWMLKLQ